MTQNAISCALIPFLSISFAAQPSMMVAISGSSPAQIANASGQPSDHTLHDGTPIKLRLGQNLSSGEAKAGQEIPFEVLERIDVDGIGVIPKGSSAIGVVTEAQAKRSMGRAGKLNISISYVRLADSEKAALRAVKDSSGGSHTGAMTGAMVATSLILWPAAPFFLLIKGKDVNIPKGTEITAFVNGDMRLDMARFGAAQPASGSAVSGQTSLAVESSPTGADIEVDGNFVGSTPSAVSVPSGSHEIIVKKKGYAPWIRTMNVTGFIVHLNAELDKSGSQ
jgi:hypothetical protein